MRVRLAALLALVALLAVADSIVGAPVQKEPPSPFEKVKQILNDVKEGFGVVSGVADALVLVADQLEAKGEVTIKPLPATVSDYDLEAGLTLKIPYEVRFQYAESRGYSDGTILADLYVVLAGQVVHREYYTFPNDDDYDFTTRGSVYIGAKKWPCRNPTDEVRIVAVLVDRRLGSINTSQKAEEARTRHERGVRNDPGLTLTGFWASGESYIGLTQLPGRQVDKDEAVVQLTVFNPYSLQTKKTDSGAVKEHGETFGLEFDVLMNYSFGYPEFQVLDPEPARVGIGVNDLASKNDWTFGPRPDLKPFVAGKGLKDTRPVQLSGSHGGLEHEGFALYADDYDASVSGKNRVFALRKTAKGLAKVAQPYQFDLQVRRDPELDECGPIQYLASDGRERT